MVEEKKNGNRVIGKMIGALSIKGIKEEQGQSRHGNLPQGFWENGMFKNAEMSRMKCRWEAINLDINWLPGWATILQEIFDKI